MPSTRAYKTGAIISGATTDGTTIVADSAASTGLRWQGNFAAGKNKIINGDFSIWQRGTSFSTTGYTADRWRLESNNTITLSQQTFTPGTAPVAGYEGTFFVRFNRTARPSAFDDYLIQRIEDVRTFAGQTVTLSFWAKTNSGTTTLSGAYLEQWFGSGGSASPVYVDTTGALTLTTSWQRFTKTITVPSVSGKTIGTSSFLALTFGMGNSVGTSVVYDIWGVQLEAGNVATSFQTATGTLQGELAACQRYYYRQSGGDSYGCFATGAARSTTVIYAFMPLPVTMRVAPTSMDLSTISVEDYSGTTWNSGTFTLESGSQQKNMAWIRYTHGSAVFTQYRPAFLSVVGSSSAYIGFSAEL